MTNEGRWSFSVSACAFVAKQSIEGLWHPQMREDAAFRQIARFVLSETSENYQMTELSTTQ
ncbi:hypothetical protein MKK84_16260 [Methylobacterium sp. E-065]|uniref:hypothetical protein n=1 Tax=Methylobacterium sp. E-065 TaxID=2836583 RepID=UPI001FB94AA1|nr:hypothetical protein [Methylobacterium sp. E-065]MCJ2018977.1 hypothetical protein [Methylobacterium sp. E-065]